MKKFGYSCVTLLYVWAGIAGILISITNAFQLKYQRTDVFFIVLLLCGGAALFFQSKKKYGKSIGWAILAGSVLWLFLTQGEKLTGSFLCVKKTVLETVEHYLEIYLGSVLRTAESADLAVVVLGICVGGIFSYSVACMRHAWLSVLLVLLGILAPFAVGKTPKPTETILCLIVLPGIVSMKMNRKQSGITAVILAGAAFGIGSLLLGTQMTRFFQEQRAYNGQWTSVLKENSGQFFKKAQGGVSDGEVGGAGTFAQEDTKQLLVITEKRPQGKIYLQGYIGNAYGDNRWKAEGKTGFRNWIRQQDVKVFDVRNLLYKQLKDSRLETEKIHIENIGANKAYKYIPYGGYYEKTDSIVADAYAKGNAGKYDVSYIPFSMVDLKKVEKTESSLENAYFQYVLKQDTKVPKTVEKAFREEIETQIQADDMWGIFEEVASALEGQAKYSLKPGKTPPGKDVAEYFYFENRKGYCEHFATVATLMLRMKGIPARYVAGYAVNPNEFVQKEDGTYEAVVTGDSAHAWAEAYVSGIGWIPVETTPGYTESVTGDTVGEMGDVSHPEVETETEEPQQIEQEMNGEKEENLQQNTDAGKEKTQTDTEEKTSITKSVYKMIGSVLAVILAITVALLGRRIYLINKRKQRRGKGYNGYVRELFASLFELLVLDGKLKKGDEADEYQMMRICEFYPGVSKEMVEQMLEIAYRASFGKGTVTKEECQLCLKLYRQVKKEVFAETSFWKKTWWKYWRGISI